MLPSASTESEVISCVGNGDNAPSVASLFHLLSTLNATFLLVLADSIPSIAKPLTFVLSNKLIAVFDVNRLLL